MKYKVGDKVRVKSIEWYNANKNGSGSIICGNEFFVNDMSRYCGCVVTINEIHPDGFYRITEEIYWWTDEMIECLIEPAPVMINLDKACKYLEDILYEVATGVTCEPDVMTVESTTMENFINNFRKAMEE